MLFDLRIILVTFRISGLCSQSRAEDWADIIQADPAAGLRWIEIYSVLRSECGRVILSVGSHRAGRSCVDISTLGV